MVTAILFFPIPQSQGLTYHKKNSRPMNLGPTILVWSGWSMRVDMLSQICGVIAAVIVSIVCAISIKAMTLIHCGTRRARTQQGMNSRRYILGHFVFEA